MWRNYTKEEVGMVTDGLGYYTIADDDEVIYIGEGKLKTRLLSHFPDGGDPIVGGSRFDFEEANSKVQALLLQNAALSSFQQIHGRLPRFNQKSKN